MVGVPAKELAALVVGLTGLRTLGADDGGVTAGAGTKGDWGGTDWGGLGGGVVTGAASCGVPVRRIGVAVVGGSIGGGVSPTGGYVSGTDSPAGGGVDGATGAAEGGGVTGVVRGAAGAWVMKRACAEIRGSKPVSLAEDLPSWMLGVSCIGFFQYVVYLLESC